MGAALPHCHTAAETITKLIPKVNCKTLRRLPSGFNNPSDLQQLDLDGCRALSSLPHRMSRLRSLPSAAAGFLQHASSLAGWF